MARLALLLLAVHVTSVCCQTFLSAYWVKSFAVEKSIYENSDLGGFCQTKLSGSTPVVYSQFVNTVCSCGTCPCDFGQAKIFYSQCTSGRREVLESEESTPEFMNSTQEDSSVSTRRQLSYSERILVDVPGSVTWGSYSTALGGYSYFQYTAECAYSNVLGRALLGVVAWCEKGQILMATSYMLDDAGQKLRALFAGVCIPTSPGLYNDETFPAVLSERVTFPDGSGFRGKSCPPGYTTIDPNKCGGKSLYDTCKIVCWANSALVNGVCVCGEGYYNQGSSCVRCEAGYVCWGFDRRECPGARVENGVRLLAQYSSSGERKCTLCPLDKPYGPYRGTSINTCISCTGNTYYNTMQNKCMSCPAGKTGPDQISMVGGFECRSCVSGSQSVGGYTYLQILPGCTECPAGSKSDTVTGSCTLCPVNTFSDYGTITSCKPCPGGRTTNGLAGRSACSFCLDGYYKSTDVSNPRCFPCPTGTKGVKNVFGTNLVPSYLCTACSLDGQYAAAGSTSCSTCPSFSVPSPDKGSCLNCGLDEIPVYPDNTCNCRTGFYGSPCSQCIPGQYGERGKCLLCPIGTYSTTNAATSCATCSSGKSTLAVGSSSVAQCMTYQCSTCTAEELGALSVSKIEDAIKICLRSDSVCMDFYNNLPQGSCPQNWFADPYLDNEVALGNQGDLMGDTVKRFHISPDGKMFAIIHGAPLEGLVSVYKFTNAGNTFEHVIMNLAKVVQPSGVGSKYVSLVWGSSSRYLYAFAQNGFIMDRFDTTSTDVRGAWKQVQNNGTIYSESISNSFIPSASYNFTYESGQSASCRIIRNSEIMCLYPRKYPQTVGYEFFIHNGITGLSTWLGYGLPVGIMGTNASSKLDDQWGITYDESGDTIKVHYVGIKGIYYFLMHPTSVSSKYRPYPCKPQKTCIDEELLIFSVDQVGSKPFSPLKIRGNRRGVFNKRTNSFDEVLYTSLLPDKWLKGNLESVPNAQIGTFGGGIMGIHRFDSANYTFLVSVTTIQDWDISSLGEIVVVTTINNQLALGRLSRCKKCQTGKASMAGSIGIDSCICTSGTYSINRGSCNKCNSPPSPGFFNRRVCTSVSNSMVSVCSQCQIDQYVSTPCAEASDTVCGNCTNCVAGEYRASPCTGIGMTPDQGCTPCTKCKKDQFVASMSLCPGTGSSDAGSICQSCTISCRWGQYIEGRCDGQLTYNSLSCVSCTKCPMGQYYTSGCNGTTFTSVHQCDWCDSCDAGNYVTDYSICDGTSNEKGTFKCAPCPACPAGYYNDPPCTGRNSQPTCKPCPVCAAGNYRTYINGKCGCSPCMGAIQCQQGYYKVVGQTCSGTGFSDNTCKACGTCATGQYISKYCDGNSISGSVCAQCRTSCPAGQRLLAECEGTELADRGCQSCLSSCPVDFYKSSSCSGTTMEDTTTCTMCSDCPVDTYRSSPCTGTSTTENKVCTACSSTTCALGQVLFARCQGWGTSDNSLCAPCAIVCGVDQFVNADCTGCQNCSGTPPNTCSAGQYILASCNGRGGTDRTCATCKSCPTGTYRSVSCDGTTTKDVVQCLPCSCGSGKYASSKCTGLTTTDTSVCTSCTLSCSAGNYLAGACNYNSNYNCTACRAPCGAAQDETVSCTGITNRVCVIAASCSQPCGAGTYKTAECAQPNTQKVCTACTVCTSGTMYTTLNSKDPGQYISSPCTPTSDTVCNSCRNPCTSLTDNAQSAEICSGTSRYCTPISMTSIFFSSTYEFF